MSFLIIKSRLFWKFLQDIDYILDTIGDKELEKEFNILKIEEN